MKKILIIGSGISALSCAITCADLGMQVNMISSAMPERSQSVMAEGGINAAINKNDSPAKHAEDTIKSACYIENEADIKAMCESAADIIAWLDKLGTVFSRTENNEIAQRAFGGQSFNRTCYSGTCTGKQIMSSLIAKARQLTCEGKLEQNYDYNFCNLIIKDDVCYGANFVHKYSGEKKIVYADAVVMATGNDWRSIEAGANTYACKDGQYRGLATWNYDEEAQVLRGQLTLPMPIATRGGSIGLNPTVNIAHDMLGYPDARQLARIIVSVGLAQNFAAVKALTSTGIQAGHMKLQAKSLALLSGAKDKEVAEVVKALLKAPHMNLETAQHILQNIRN